MFAASYPEGTHKLRHNLGAHPLLELDALGRARRVACRRSVEYNRGDLPIGVDGKPEGNGLSIGATIRGIARPNSWAVLKNIEQAPAYAALLADLLGELQAEIVAKTGRMMKTQGFIFVSSPNAVTPYHFDPEHNILMQLVGEKAMTVFPPGNAACAPDPVHETYHTGGGRELSWRDELAEHGMTFRLEPGEAIYVPVMAPHYVRNGPVPSISLSITWRSEWSFAEADARAFNKLLRSWGVRPRPPGGGPRATGASQSRGASCDGSPGSIDWRHDAAQGGCDGNRPAPLPTPEQLVAELVLLLDLERAAATGSSAASRPREPAACSAGQAIAQALVAARRTVPEDRHTHSLHAYFLRGGTDELPIEFRVKRDLDGRSFSNRRVVASQQGEPILNLVASFQKPQHGPAHQAATMPDVPPPEDLEPDAAIRRRFARRCPKGPARPHAAPRPIDIRSVEPRNWQSSDKRPPLAHCWFRTVAALPDNQPIHRAVLAYASDFQLLATAIQPHGLSFHRGEVKAASLDHAIWFHGPFRADDWLLYVTDSPWSGLARGFGRGQIFTREGRLVASVAQEGMLREVPRKA
jgi:acyl-CoA thioesterase-2